MVRGVFSWVARCLNRHERLARTLLWIAAGSMLAFAAATLWPLAEGRSNRLGFVSACPFAPCSTVFFLSCAGLSLAFLPVLSRLIRWGRS